MLELFLETNEKKPLVNCSGRSIIVLVSCNTDFYTLSKWKKIDVLNRENVLDIIADTELLKTILDLDQTHPQEQKMKKNQQK